MLSGTGFSAAITFRTAEPTEGTKLIPGLIEGVQRGLLAHATQDDVGLYWLTDPSQAAKVAAALMANKDKAGIAQVWFGDEIKARFGDPGTDPRVPDLVVIPSPG